MWWNENEMIINASVKWIECKWTNDSMEWTMIKQACNEQMISVPLSLYDSSILQHFASYSTSPRCFWPSRTNNASETDGSKMDWRTGSWTERGKRESPPNPSGLLSSMISTAIHVIPVAIRRTQQRGAAERTPFRIPIELRVSKTSVPVYRNDASHNANEPRCPINL